MQTSMPGASPLLFRLQHTQEDYLNPEMIEKVCAYFIKYSQSAQSPFLLQEAPHGLHEMKIRSYQPQGPLLFEAGVFVKTTNTLGLDKLVPNTQLRPIEVGIDQYNLCCQWIELLNTPYLELDTREKRDHYIRNYLDLEPPIRQQELWNQSLASLERLQQSLKRYAPQDLMEAFLLETQQAIKEKKIFRKISLPFSTLHTEDDKRIFIHRLLKYPRPYEILKQQTKADLEALNTSLAQTMPTPQVNQLTRLIQTICINPPKRNTLA